MTTHTAERESDRETLTEEQSTTNEATVPQKLIMNAIKIQHPTTNLQ